MSGAQFFLPKQQNVDTNGNPLAGAKLYFYIVNTSTLKNVYQDEDFVTAHANPVEADSDGRFPAIYMNGAYKVILKDAADTTIWTQPEWSGITNLFNDVIEVDSDTAIDSIHKFSMVWVTGLTKNITLALLNAASAAEGFVFGVVNEDTTYNAVIDPSGSETVNGQATITFGPGEGGILISTGTSWLALNTQQLAVNDLTADTAPDIEADSLLTYDNSASTHKRILMTTLLKRYLSGIQALDSAVNWNTGIITPGIYNTSGTTYAGTLPLGASVEHTGTLVVLGGNALNADLQQIWYNGLLRGTWTRMTTDGGTNWTTWQNITQTVKQFNGRLTLTSGTPVLTSDTTAQTTVYYTPYNGNLISLYDGTNFTNYEFTELSQLTTDAAKSPAAAANNSNYDMLVWNDSGTLRCTRGPAWSSDTSRGTGAGTAELTRVKGVLVNAYAITNGPAAQRGTYVGTIRTNASAAVDVKFGATPAAGGSAAVIGLWNAYNRVPVAAATLESADSWMYATGSFQQMNNSASNKVSFIRGLNEEAVSAVSSHMGQGDTAGDVLGVAIGLDSATTATGLFTVGETNAANRKMTWRASYDALPGLGFHYLAPLEYGSTTVTWYGDNGAATSTQVGMTMRTTW